MSNVRSHSWLLAAVAGLAASASHAQIAWRSAPDAPPQAAAAGSVAQSLAALASRPDQTRFIVECARTLSNTERLTLAQTGVTLLAPLGNAAYFASIDARTLNAARVESTGLIRRARAIDTNWKMHELFVAGERTPWAEVGGTPENPTLGLYIQLHEDVILDADIEASLQAQGANIREVLVSVNGYVIEAPRDRVEQIAQLDIVQWIEPALPSLSELALKRNNENRVLTRADIAQSSYGLDGTGVNVLIYDGGRARATHSFFAGRLTTIDSSSISSHATHVSGTVGGSGVPGTGNHRGMAPNATLFSAGFQTDGSGTFLYNNPGDIEQDYGLAINTHSVVLTNNSIGTNTETNGFACSIQGDYGLTDSVIDAIARGSLGNAPIIVWAAGNERQGSRCDIEGFGDYYSSAPPAGAKNHLCIGAVNANNDSMTSFSSWGPTDDGRMKPDFVAPGCQSSGDGGVTSSTSSSDTSTGASCGTSMAAPTATGIVALMLQDHRAQFPSLPDPSPATVKALLAHTAVDLGNPGPDYQFGYGSIRADAAIDQQRLDAHREVDIAAGQTRTLYFNVAPGAPNVKVTAAWSDAPGTPNTSNALVNDVDIRLVSPSGTVFLPWTLNPANPSAAAVRNAANRRDNLEQVLVDNPEPGQWRAEIIGHSIAVGPQTVSVVGPAGIAERGVRILLAPVPDLVEPGTILQANVTIDVTDDVLAPGSALVHYRTQPGSFTTAPLTHLGGSSYTASLPAVLCDNGLEFFVSAAGVDTGAVSAPAGGESGPVDVQAGVNSIGFNDTFAIDLGWTIDNSPTLTDGAWQRAIPVTGADAWASPGADFDGNGWCYVTDNAAGNSDVDNGSTTLTSPTFDGSGGEAHISYARWFHNTYGANPGIDVMVVEISNNDGASWQNLETVGPGGPNNSGGWVHKSFRIADIVEPTTTMKIRFNASDLGPQAYVEAAVDAVSVSFFTCENPQTSCPADLNNDSVLDFFDITIYLALFSANDPAADLNNDTNFDFFDVVAYLALFDAGCP